MLQPQSKSHRLADPIATCGDRVYIICSQNGLFTDPWGGHVPGEMWGVWDHPIKLLDGFWFGLSMAHDDAPRWLIEASECRACVGYNEFDYHDGPLAVTRRDFVPDGLEGAVITLTFHPNEPVGEPFIDPFTLTLHALFRSDLRPAWLGEEAGLTDGKDIGNVQDDSVIFTDANNAWTCVVGADHAPAEVAIGDDLWAAQRTRGNGASTHLKYALRFREDIPATITFIIAGSSTSQAEAITAFRQLKAERACFINAKTARYQGIVETSRVITPDATLNDAMAWSKLINQMLARHVPEYGLGVGAGLPEYPWWFGIDTEYAVLPMLQSGQFELARDTLRLLKRWSLEHNAAEPGRVLHEMSTTGIVYNKGNLVETPVFTRAVHQYWLWTGDLAFLDEMYPFCKQGVLDYALGKHDPDGDLCPSGRSIIETLEMHAGFEVIDVAAYTWEALTRLIDMAHALGDDQSVPELRRKADHLAGIIRDEWWLEDEGLFADVRASVDEDNAALTRLGEMSQQQNWPPDAQKQVHTARRLFEPFLARYSEQPRDTDLHWLLRHWVVMCPVEVGLATPAQAERVISRLQSREFCNEWGMYLHPERHDVMSINTGMLALSAGRYGRVDESLSVIHKLTRAFSYRTPGAVAEALPDQWCFLQLWSNVGLVAPVVECFLGIEPRAGERRLRVTPHLPSIWNQAAVQQLRVGGALMNIRATREGNTFAVNVTGATGWSVEAGIVLPHGATPQAVWLNGQPSEWRIEQTPAGPCLVCEAVGDAELVVEV